MSQLIEISPQQALQMWQNGEAILADVRKPEDFAQAHPQGAVSLTEHSWPQFAQQHEYDQPIILSCYHGISSKKVAEFLLQQGYEHIYSVIGGFEGWQKAGLPLESGFN